MDRTWYHGSPLVLTLLHAGSTITQNRRLAEVFSHKPSIVSVLNDGTIQHDGTAPGYLYRIAKEIGPDDVYPHPRSTMAPGQEWLTRRELQVTLIGPIQVTHQEQLTAREIAALQERLHQRSD